MRVLDLFCGAGGAAMGLHRAWPDAEIVGVDITPQPNYPFKFVRDDAMNWIDGWHQGFDFVWASPPCQAYTMMRHMGKNAGKNAPDLVPLVREKLLRCDLPWVIENVIGAPLGFSIRLCGSSFGLGVRRHRVFEASFLFFGLPCSHDAEPVPVWGDGRPSRQETRKARRPIAVYGDHPQQPGDKTYRCNRARTLKEGQEAMGIDWMEWKELTQAVPPAYSEYIAKQVPL
jgi:DNA (cytosine-5)-methyltransferase 1